MLKRLELIGFKSFADKTRFDFAPGVTAIVGPNGSGKSNVVDAVRWLLGEQSAKALRGGEMTDVIFNGSATRKSLGMAEVSMTFDNTSRRLDRDDDEVRVTRRVFRDGESQYEINGQRSLLKDVRDLFLGSGAAAYGVIEQGRVDALLTATPRERRTLFEEAAGVSRFRAKKLEAQKKLERVEADLVRIHDILSELDGQVRSLKLQSAKAERHQEYHDRLTAVRVAVGRAELADLDARLAEELDALKDYRQTLAAVTATASAGETGLQELDRALTEAAEETRRTTQAAGTLARRLTELLALQQSEAEKSSAVAAERQAVLQRSAEAEVSLRSLADGCERSKTGLERLRQDAQAARTQAEAAEKSLAEWAGTVHTRTRLAAQGREQQFAKAAEAGQARAEAESVKAQADRLTQELARKHAESQSAQARRATLERLLHDLTRTDDELRDRADQARHQVKVLRVERTELRAQADGLQPELDRRREERSALCGQADVLQQLETSYEGVGVGVRAVLDRVRADDPALAPRVAGLVADLLTVDRAHAELVDLALGEVAQRLVVRGADDLPAVLAAIGTPAGRVGFVTLRPPTGPPTGHGRALSDLVQSAVPGLAEQLLGHCFLADAPPESFAAPARYVQPNGHLWEADGGVTVGRTAAGTGLLSRKSELRDLVGRVAQLDRELADLGDRQQQLRGAAEALAAPLAEAEADLAALSGETSSLREQLGGHRQAERQLRDLIDLLAQESQLLERERDASRARHEQATARARAADEQSLRAEADALAAAASLKEAEAARDRSAHDHTTAQVHLGRLTEQLHAESRQQADAQKQLAQAKFERQSLAESLRTLTDRARAAEVALLRRSMELADVYRQKDDRDRDARQALRHQARVAAQRARLQEELRRGRAQWQERQDAAHGRELAARELTGRRTALLHRFQEELAIDLTRVPADPPPPDARAEIAELRQKIAKLGAVNPESIPHLAEAEARAGNLRAEFDDLTAGRDKLLEVIEQVNADSRKLFAETVAAVRTHFQELFRKLFGGGVADIQLDSPDVLEAGVEVVAHPPGKQAQRLSLLSGGERALVAAALLLAMFRAKPGPFCLLDEMDAAMDDANTERLGARLAEIAGTAQFVVITHKKRMMAHAQVLHGVTMQESGVSKLVAVRFEDWPDDAHAPATAA